MHYVRQTPIKDRGEIEVGNIVVEQVVFETHRCFLLEVFPDYS